MELTGLLERLVAATHSFLVIDLPSCGRYVQFLTEDGDWLRAETVGNRWLDHDIEAHLGEDDDALLVRFGWMPTGSDEGDCGNYWRMWDHTEVAEAAQLAALTISRVHGLRVPESSNITIGRTSTWPGYDGRPRRVRSTRPRTRGSRSP
jgi:hypothetical protein